MAKSLYLLFYSYLHRFFASSESQRFGSGISSWNSLDLDSDIKKLISRSHFFIESDVGWIRLFRMDLVFSSWGSNLYSVILGVRSWSGFFSLRVGSGQPQTGFPGSATLFFFHGESYLLVYTVKRTYRKSIYYGIHVHVQYNFFFFLSPGTTIQAKNHIWSVGYENKVKRVRGVYFWRHFWKLLKNEDLSPEIFEKCM